MKSKRNERKEMRFYKYIINTQLLILSSEKNIENSRSSPSKNPNKWESGDGAEVPQERMFQDNLTKMLQLIISYTATRDKPAFHVVLKCSVPYVACDTCFIFET